MQRANRPPIISTTICTGGVLARARSAFKNPDGVFVSPGLSGLGNMGGQFERHGCMCKVLVRLLWCANTIIPHTDIHRHTFRTLRPGGAAAFVPVLRVKTLPLILGQTLRFCQLAGGVGLKGAAITAHLISLRAAIAPLGLPPCAINIFFVYPSGFCPLKINGICKRAALIARKRRAAIFKALLHLAKTGALQARRAKLIWGVETFKYLLIFKAMTALITRTCFALHCAVCEACQPCALICWIINRTAAHPALRAAIL